MYTITQQILANWQQQIDARGAIIIDSVPVSAVRFVTLTGQPTTSLAIARAQDGSYVSLIPASLTPRVPELIPFFANHQTIDAWGGEPWRILALPYCQSVAAVLEQLNQVFGDAHTPVFSVEAQPAPQAMAIPQGYQTPAPMPAPILAEQHPVPTGEHPQQPATAGPVRVPAATPDTQAVQNALPFCLDMTARAERNELPRIIGRDHEVDQVMEILLQRETNCPLLVGEPGVGKTAVAYLLAQRFAARQQLPARLANARLFALQLPEIQARAQYKGELEKQWKSLIDALEQQHDAVVFIDEIHQLAQIHGELSLLEMLKPKLADGRLRILGATTEAEYKQFIHSDGALRRRFGMVKVEEPSPEDSVAMLRARVPELSEHHGITIPDELITACVELADEYFPGEKRPAKAYKLLDRALSRQVMKSYQEEA